MYLPLCVLPLHMPAWPQDACYAAFIQRVRDNLHIVLTMSPVGDSFRVRCRQFPSLISCSTIDWFTQVRGPAGLARGCTHKQGQEGDSSLSQVSWELPPWLPWLPPMSMDERQTACVPQALHAARVPQAEIWRVFLRARPSDSAFQRTALTRTAASATLPHGQAAWHPTQASFPSVAHYCREPPPCYDAPFLLEAVNMHMLRFPLFSTRGGPAMVQSTHLHTLHASTPCAIPRPPRMSAACNCTRIFICNFSCIRLFLVRAHLHTHICALQWPEEALLSVSRKFLAGTELGGEEVSHHAGSPHCGIHDASLKLWFQSVSECFRVFQSVSECFRVFQSVSRVFQSVSECFRVFQSVSECFRVFHGCHMTFTTCVSASYCRRAHASMPPCLRSPHTRQHAAPPRTAYLPHAPLLHTLMRVLVCGR